MDAKEVNVVYSCDSVTGSKEIHWLCCGFHPPCMLHVPSTLPPNRFNFFLKMHRNYTNESAELRIQLKIEEELHDAQRVHTYGQEEDLRLTLKIVMERVTELVRGDVLSSLCV